MTEKRENVTEHIELLPKRCLILIYGAHLVALEYYRHLCRLDYSDRIIGFAVSDMQDNPDELEGKPVKSISDYTDYADKCTVVIAMPRKYHNVVESGARDLGFNDYVRIGLEDMSSIKGDWLIANCSGILPFKIMRSPNDPSWLDALAEGSYTTSRFKYPTLYHCDVQEMINESLRYVEIYDAEIEGVTGLKDQDSSGMNTSNANPEQILNVFMAVDTNNVENVRDGVFDPWIKPILVGSAGSVNTDGYSRDDEYEGNLSGKNLIFAEMTGAHWIWKMAHDSEYKGLCHYRRFFDLTGVDIFNMKEADIDALLTTPRFVPGGIRKMFVAETPVKKHVINSMLDSVEKFSPGERDDFDAYLNSHFYFPNNMVIAKSELYDEYCEWIFPVLIRMLEIDLEAGYGHDDDRHIAYAAELLTSFFFMKRKHVLKIAYTDYIFIEHNIGSMKG